MIEFSASQLETFALCPRKWAWAKIDGLPTRDSAATELGGAVHKQLERWLRDGTPLDLTTGAGEIAMSGLHLLPQPKTPGMQIEEWFHLDMMGYRFRGMKDVQILGLPVPLVMDHKTCGDFKWAKTADDLVTNIQAALYAADAMHQTGADACDLQWTYMRTRGARRAEAVRVRVTREQIIPTLNRIAGYAAEMTALLNSGLTAIQIPCNPGACEAFGGCEFKHLCNLSPEERLKAVMSQGTASFLSTLQTRNNGGAINPPPVAAPVAVPPAPPAPVWNGSQWVLPAAPAAPPVAAPAPPVAPPPGSYVVTPGQPITPAEAVGRHYAPEHGPGVWAPDGPAQVAPPVPAPVAAPVAPPQAEPVEAPPAKPKRTRRTKAEMEAARARGPSPAAALDEHVEDPEDEDKAAEALDALEAGHTPAERRSLAATLLRQAASLTRTAAEIVEGL